MYFKLSQYVRIFFFKNPCHSAWQIHVLDLLTSLPLNMCDNLQVEGEVICCISIRDFTVCPTQEPIPQSQEKWSCGSAIPSDSLGHSSRGTSIYITVLGGFWDTKIHICYPVWPSLVKYYCVQYIESFQGYFNICSSHGCIDFRI